PPVSLPSPPVATVPTLPPGPRPGGQDAAIRGVIAQYVQAIESKDVGLFRSVKPNLSADEEKRLAESFKLIKSQKVGISVDAIQVDGTRATVRIHRQDTINGKEMKSNQQTFTLVQSGGAWRIES